MFLHMPYFDGEPNPGVVFAHDQSTAGELSPDLGGLGLSVRRQRGEYL
jgi:hypothetical protein